MRSGAEEEATAFGPLIQVNAWAAWGIGCSSSRKRRSCLRRNRGCEVRRQASLRRLLYSDKNVSRPPSVKFTGHRFRRQRHADPAESRGEHHAGNRLTID
jgi:hypothetical protein